MRNRIVSSALVLAHRGDRRRLRDLRAVGGVALAQHPLRVRPAHGASRARNREGSAPRVARSDIDAARSENWWGKAITVSSDQIFQN